MLTASVRGVIFDSRARMPIRGAAVRIEGVATQTTGRDGFFALKGLESGRQTLHVSINGLEAAPYAVDLEADRTTHVRISIALPDDSQGTLVEAVPLPPLEVEITRSRRIGRMRSYFRRLLSGRGTFITREDLDRLAPSRTTDVLRTVLGLRVEDRVAGAEFVRSNRGCMLPVFLDGFPIPGMSPDDIHPDDIEVIEIYRGAVETPTIFRAACGALVIWTRDPLRG